MTSTSNKLYRRPHSLDQPLPTWVPGIIVALISALAFTLATYRVGFVFGQDFPAHIRWAQRFAEDGLVYLPHYTYQQLIVILRALLPFNIADLIQDGSAAWLAARSYKIAGLMVIAIFYALTGVLIQQRLAKTIKSVNGKYPAALSVVLSISLMCVTPVTLLTLIEHRLYLGYIGINVYHNPTVTMLKPLALLLFWALMGPLEGKQTRMNIVLLCGITVFSTLTKPNFSLSLLPVLMILIFCRLVKKKPVSWFYLGLGFILPAVLVLGYQYWYGYVSNDTTRIVFAPLREMHFYAPAGLGWMFFLSIAFPLCVSIFRFRQVVKDLGFITIWGAFIISATMTYLLAEEGGREYNLNFQWGAQVCLFILFIHSVLWLVGHWHQIGSNDKVLLPAVEKILLGLLFGLHVLSGIAWYLAEVIQPRQWWY